MHGCLGVDLKLLRLGLGLFRLGPRRRRRLRGGLLDLPDSALNVARLLCGGGPGLRVGGLVPENGSTSLCYGLTIRILLLE